MQNSRTKTQKVVKTLMMEAPFILEKTTPFQMQVHNIHKELKKLLHNHLTPLVIQFKTEKEEKSS